MGASQKNRLDICHFSQLWRQFSQELAYVCLLEFVMYLLTNRLTLAELSWLVTEDIDGLICPVRELLLDQEDSESCFMLQQQSALAILGNFKLLSGV